MNPSPSNKTEPNRNDANKTSVGAQRGADSNSPAQKKEGGFQAPVINLPKGGGAIQGIGEKFQANPVTGTGSMSVPIAISPGRTGFTPQLGLSYDSGSGNGVFGLGWDVGLPSISRKTQTGLPQYDGLPQYEDAFDSDVFILSGAEDLIPILDANNVPYQREEDGFTVYRYRPRIEGLFARIEKWVKTDGTSHWLSVSKENINTLYGESQLAKITDPADSRKVFQWRIEKSWDDKGNLIVYQYKKEDAAGLEQKPIFEKNRNASNAYAQTYLKRVCYGNTVPYQTTSFAADNQWLFELVFDYGEHFKAGDETPAFEEKYPWPLRTDIFSSFRSGFDIRTYRLCRRILMFHHLEAELGVADYLVKATHLAFDENPNATQLLSVTHTGYRIDTTGKYVAKSFPPVSFAYTEQKLDESIYSIHDTDLPNVPQGIDGQQYQFNDLYGEGLSGILKQNGTGWYYKRNLGAGQFGPQELVARVPSLAAHAQVQITDFGGDGLTNVLVQTDTLNGYFELSEEQEWSHFRPFAHPVSFNLNDPNLRMIDLDGNGMPDLVITEDECFVWYPAAARDGFKVARRVAKALDEETGPRIVFNEIFQTIFLADMSGDGLSDIVRIRNGEVCYWANLGYGRFSHKITMQNAPHFDLPDYYDPARLRLSDIDGSGTTDILYLGRNEIFYWLNQAGNRWEMQAPIVHFPQSSNLHSVAVFDLLGNGTACIVWASPLPTEANTPMKYLQLMGNTSVEGNKPYLLKEVNNNMGAITRMKYEASTKFYLEDRKQGKPWITKLPFPVQVLVRQEVFDAIAGNHFVSRYAYHHGYFDRSEREFRGFGMVEQWDTEDYETLSKNTLFTQQGQNWSEQSDMPPIYTKTWFHNGYWREGGKITQQYAEEYYSDDPERLELSDTPLPTGLSTTEIREALRACKGRPLRVEVYGLDGSTTEKHPYTVTETKYQIQTIQKKGPNRFASFYVYECESLSYQYERNPADPRIAHQTTLEIDDFGNVVKAAAIVYPRRSGTDSVHPEQNRGYVTYSETDFINRPDEPNWYRVGLPYAQRSYEITGLNLSPPYEKEALKLAILGASTIPFEQTANVGLQKRLLSAAKSSFYTADLSTELPFGEIAPHALPYRAYEAVYTEGLIARFEKDEQALIGITEIEGEAGFLPMDGLWWRHAGRAEFDAAHFYLPLRQFDPLGHAYHLGYDAYHLAMTTTSTQVSGKTIRTSAQLNYRTLQASRLTDPNGNFSTVLFDEMGLVMATAVGGKNGEGDTLAGYTYPPYLNQDIRELMYNNPHVYLQGATAFFYYDLNAWQRDGQPNYALGIVRETHVSEENGTPTKTQINFSYSDGFGQAIMVKVQAEPGDAFRLENGTLTKDHAAIRWVGNGRTVLNNKGKPVKQYEPYFSHSYAYERETELVQYGVTPILHYDAAGRNIRTDLPDGTFTKVEFSPWEQKNYDQNDTMRESQWYIERGSPEPNDPEPNVINNPGNYPKRAAWLAAQHDNTYKVEHLDTLGRIFLLVDDDGSTEKVKTRFGLDLAGNQVRVTDALGRLITINEFNMANEPIRTHSMDAGRRWSLSNSMGNPLYQWNDRMFRSRMVYDALQRNTGVFLVENGATEQQVYQSIYGELHPNPEGLNFYGQLWQVYDQSGLLSSEGFDFKGNPLGSTKQLALDYKNRLDWSANPLPALENEIFRSTSTYDALNRPLKTSAPDQSETEYSYNEANFLEKIKIRLRGAATATPFVENIDYDAKGQRTRIRYGNGLSTSYDYDPHTFRLIRLRSTRNNGSEVLQDLQYHYDPVGNITDLHDAAQQTLFFANQLVEPHGSYSYDALYRLLKAEGREQIGQSNNPADPKHQHIVDFSLNPNDGQAMRRYREQYTYDALGNILQVSHHAGQGTNFENSWTRQYTYSETSQLEANQVSNHLTKTTLLSSDYSYTHDVHGNMTRMPHLPAMRWDFADQLAAVELPTGQEYYCYTIAGGKDFGVRTRKVTEQGGKIKERIYIGDFELYRERNAAGTLELERETLHVQDDKGRIALVDTLTIDNSSFITPHSSLTRYQLSSYLGSASIELDDQADLISYEEYYPFGASSYRAGRSATEVAQKRYRYVGKERDESTGLDEYGARYYASWLCRFVSVDALKDEYPFYTAYLYSGNSPISFFDLDGKEKTPNNRELNGQKTISDPIQVQDKDGLAQFNFSDAVEVSYKRSFWEKTKGFFKEYGGNILDGLQTSLDIVGLIPVFGEIADGINGLISLARGDYAGAALSFAAMIPFVGWAATGAKFIKTAIKYSDEAVGLVKYGDEVVENVASLKKNSVKNTKVLRDLFTDAKGTPLKDKEWKGVSEGFDAIFKATNGDLKIIGSGKYSGKYSDNEGLDALLEGRGQFAGYLGTAEFKSGRWALGMDSAGLQQASFAYTSSRLIRRLKYTSMKDIGGIPILDFHKAMADGKFVSLVYTGNTKSLFKVNLDKHIWNSNFKNNPAIRERWEWDK